MPWLWNSFHRTIRIDALIVLPRRISDLMPTQRTQLAPQSIRLDDSPGISRFLLDPQCRRSFYIRCVATGIARVGNRIFHPDVLLLQTTATRLQRQGVGPVARDAARGADLGQSLTLEREPPYDPAVGNES